MSLRPVSKSGLMLREKTVQSGGPAVMCEEHLRHPFDERREMLAMNAIIRGRRRAITASQRVREIRAVGSENQALSQGAEISQHDGPSEVSFGLLQNGRCHNGEGHHLAASHERVQGVTQYLFDER